MMKNDENLIFRVQLLIKKIINLQLLLAGNLNVNMRCLQQRGIPHTIFLENKKGGHL